MRQNGLKLLKFFIIALLVLTIAACDHQVDISIYADDTWLVESDLALTQAEKDTLAFVDDEFLSSALESFGLEYLPLGAFKDDAVAGWLDFLQSYYSDVGINFQWRERPDRYTFSIQGQNLEQFEQLLPGAIELYKDEESLYYLNANLTEFNSYAAFIYKQTLRLHTGRVIDHNAPHQEGNTLVWTNPRVIKVTFKPRSQTNLSVGGSAILVFMLVLSFVIVLFFALKNRTSSSDDEYLDEYGG